MHKNHAGGHPSRKRRRQDRSTSSEGSIDVEQVQSRTAGLLWHQQTGAQAAVRPGPLEQQATYSVQQQGSNVENTNIHGSNNSITIGNTTSIHHNYGDQKFKVLDEMPYATGAGLRESGNTVDRCVKGTRKELLGVIESWAGAPSALNDTEDVGFWLEGMAGTGKSTVARTVAEDLELSGFVVVSFFFLRGDGRRGTPEMFVPTILKQLIENPGLKRSSGCLPSALLETYEANTVARKRCLDDQWDTFIKRPLLEHRHETILLVVDAVDESTEPMAIHQEMSDFLCNRDNFEGLNIRVFVTSRHEKKAGDRGHHMFHLHKIDEEIVERDIQLFFQVKFADFNARYDPDCTFPGLREIEELARRAKPLFIAAMTSFNFITSVDYDLESQFELLMMQPKGQGDYGDLDKMYFVVIAQAILRRRSLGRDSEAARKNIAIFQSLVGAVITLHEPLCYESLALLLSKKTGPVRGFLKSLRAALDIPKESGGPVRIFHQSFPDFLTAGDRVQAACEGQNLERDDIYIDQRKSNCELFEACLRLMDGVDTSSGRHGLKQDICELVGPGIRAKDIPPGVLQSKIPAPLRYACKYWVSHFASAGDGGSQYHGYLLGFLTRHLLHWIEAMSCLGSFNDAIRNLDQIHELLEEVNCKNYELCSLVADARRFIRYSKDGIEEAPLQIYSSALLFAPENSRVKKTFSKECPRWIRRSSKMDAEWNTVLHELTGHTGPIVEMKLSADGLRMATRDYFDELIVWDTTTGQLLSRGRATCMDVSPSDALVCGNASGEVRLWPDMEKRNARTLEEGNVHDRRVLDVVFSSDGDLLASIDKQGVVVVREARTGYRGQQLSREDLPDDLPLKRDINFGRSIHLSSDSDAGRFLAIPGIDGVGEEQDRGCITVWRQQPRQRSWEFYRCFTCGELAFPSIIIVGQYLTCVTNKHGKLTVWDLTLQGQGVKEVPIRKPQPGTSPRLLHLPETHLIVAPDESGSLVTYDLLDLNGPVTTFQDSDGVTGLSVSADGTLLAGRIRPNSSHVGETYLWDVSTGNRISVSIDHADSRPAVTSLSPDRKMLAVGHGVLVRLLDCELLRQQNQNQDQDQNRPAPTYAGNTGKPQQVVINPVVSPDGRFVAVGTNSSPLADTPLTVDVWDTETSEKQSLHSEGLIDIRPSNLLTFSPEARWLALMERKKLHVWDLRLRDTRPSHPSRSTDIDLDLAAKQISPQMYAAFSADGQWLSFAAKIGSRTGVVRIGVVKVDSDEPPIYHSVDCNAILALSPDHQSPAFRATLYRKQPSRLQAVDYNMEPDLAKLHLGFDIPELDPGMDTAFLPRTQQGIVLVHSERHILRSVQSSSNVQKFKLPDASLSSSDMKFCDQGRCLLSSRGGRLHVPQPHAPNNTHCLCGMAPVSYGRNSQWLFWNGRHFLSLPDAWASVNIALSVGKGAVAYQRNRGFFWLRLEERRLSQVIATQPEDARATTRKIDD